MTWAAFISSLPKISGDPLAILAYMVLAIGWIIWLLRRRRSIDFLKSLALQPEEARPTYALKAGYSYDELAGLSPKDRLRLIARRYLLIAYIFTGLALLLLLLSVVRVIPEYLNLTREMDEKAEELRKRVANERERNVDLVRGLERV